MPGESKLDCLQIGLYIRNVAITKPGGPYCGRPCNFHLRVGRTRTGISAGNVSRLLVFHINFPSYVLSKIHQTDRRIDYQRQSANDTINRSSFNNQHRQICFFDQNQSNLNFMIFDAHYWRCNLSKIDFICKLINFRTILCIIIYFVKIQSQRKKIFYFSL